MHGHKTPDMRHNMHFDKWAQTLSPSDFTRWRTRLGLTVRQVPGMAPATVARCCNPDGREVSPGTRRKLALILAQQPVPPLEGHRYTQDMRKLLRIPQKEMADELGIAQGHLSRLETGEAEWPPTLRERADTLIQELIDIEASLDSIPKPPPLPDTNPDETKAKVLTPKVEERPDTMYYTRELRQEARLTQGELADLANISRVSINRIEQGKQTPRPATEMRILRCLPCESLDLPTRQDDPQKWDSIRSFLADELPLDDLLEFLDPEWVLAVLIEEGRPSKDATTEAALRALERLDIDDARNLCKRFLHNTQGAA